MRYKKSAYVIYEWPPSAEIGALMNQLLITYPGKARTYPIGETKGHSMLYVIELSDSLENSHLKPAIKVCVEVIFTHNIFVLIL